MTYAGHHSPSRATPPLKKKDPPQTKKRYLVLKCDFEWLGHCGFGEATKGGTGLTHQRLLIGWHGPAHGKARHPLRFEHAKMGSKQLQQIVALLLVVLLRLKVRGGDSFIGRRALRRIAIKKRFQQRAQVNVAVGGDGDTRGPRAQVGRGGKEGDVNAATKRPHIGRGGGHDTGAVKELWSHVAASGRGGGGSEMKNKHA